MKFQFPRFSFGGSDKPRQEQIDLEKAAKPKSVTLSSEQQDAQLRGGYLISSNYDNRIEEMKTYWEAYQRHHWTKKCVKTIAGALSRKWELVCEDEDAQIDPAKAAIVEAFLNCPNDSDSFEALVRKIAINIVVFGHCVMEFRKVEANSQTLKSIVGATFTSLGFGPNVLPNYDQEIEDVVGAVIEGGIPGALRILPTHQIEVQTDKRGNIIGYIQWLESGERLTFAPNEVLHILHPDAQDPIYGESQIRSLTNVIATDILIDERQKAVLQSDNAIDVIYSLPNVTEEQIKRFHEQLLLQYRGASAKGRFIVTTEDVKAEDISKSKDGDFLALGKDNRDTIAMTLGVPLSILGDTAESGTTGDGQDSHMRNFVEQTVRPLAVHIESFLNRQVLSLYENVGISYLVKLQLEDTDDRMDLEQSLDVAVRNGTLTINEKRRLLNMDKYGPEGDIAWIDAKGAMTLQQLAAAAAAPMPPAAIAPKAEGEADNPDAQQHDDGEQEDVEKAIAQTRSLLRTLRKAL